MMTTTMYRTVEFKHTFPDEWVFDENENPIAPGARELANAVVSGLSARISNVSRVQQHSFYGWGFDVEFEGSTFYNVVNPADEKCYLTVQMLGYWLKWLLRKRPRDSFERYSTVLTEVLRDIPALSGINWQQYRT
jgi:hypothetical protein